MADAAVEAIEAAAAAISADGEGVAHQEAVAEVGGGGVERAWIHRIVLYIKGGVWAFWLLSEILILETNSKEPPSRSS